MASQQLSTYLDLQTILLVQAISQTGSVTGAARMLGVSQPAISQRLHRSEAKLGVTLTEKDGRSVVLTEHGEVIARKAPVIVGALAEIQAELEHLVTLKAGNVTLAVFESASSSLVPSLIYRLWDSSPTLSLNYVLAEPEDALDRVLAHEVHGAIVVSNDNRPLDIPSYETQNIHFQPLFNDEMLLALPQDHPLATEDDLDIPSLEDDDWITGCARCRAQLVSLCSGVGFQPHLSFETHNQTVMLSLVARGLGIALLPALSLYSTPVPKNVVVRKANPPLSRQIYFAARRDDFSEGPVRAVAQALRSLRPAPPAAVSATP